MRLNVTILRSDVPTCGGIGNEATVDADGSRVRSAQTGNGRQAERLSGTGWSKQHRDPGCGMDLGLQRKLTGTDREVGSHAAHRIVS
jgi:hypothetical protein